jgi:hypothetical protein
MSETTRASRAVTDADLRRSGTTRAPADDQPVVIDDQPVVIDDQPVIVEDEATTTGSPTGWRTLVEPVLAGALVLVSLSYLGRTLWSTRFVSLWTDELYSVIHFGSDGPWHAATTYDSNNHVLASIIGTLVPGPQFTPWRVRLVSYVAIGLATAAMLWEFGRRRMYLAGALVVAALSFSPFWIDLTFQARAYGVLFVASVFWCFAVWRYLDDHRTRWLVIAAVATLVGGWSQPPFVFLVGPAWALFLARTRRRDVLIAGAASAGALVVVYLPIAGQLLDTFRTYGDQFGRDYTGITRPIATFDVYLFNRFVVGFDPSDLVAGLAIVAVLVGGVVTRARRPDRQAAQIFAGSVVVFLAICLTIKTPSDRNVAVAIVPFLFAFAILVNALLTTRGGRRWRPLIATVVLIPLIVVAIDRTATFHNVVPKEDWLAADTFVDRVVPDSMTLEANRNPEYVSAYLSRPRTTRVFTNTRALAAGITAWVETYGADLQAPHTDTSPAFPAAEFRFAQQAGGYMRAVLVRPRDAGTAQLTVNDQGIDPSPRDLIFSATPPPIAPPPSDLVVVANPSSTVSRSFVMTITSNGEPVPLYGVPVTATIDYADGTTHRATATEKVVGSGAVAVELGDKPVEQVRVSIGPVQQPLTLQSAWFYSP